MYDKTRPVAKPPSMHTGKNYEPIPYGTHVSLNKVAPLMPVTQRQVISMH